MRRKMATQLMLLTMFVAMSDKDNMFGRKQYQPIKRDKPIILKTCPICGAKHQKKNRFCNEDCRIAAKKDKKIRSKKRKKRKY